MAITVTIQPGRMSSADVEQFITDENINIGAYTLNPNAQWRYDEFDNIPDAKFPYIILNGSKVYVKHPALRGDWDLTEAKITALFADSQGAFDQFRCAYFIAAAPPESKKKSASTTKNK